MSDLVARVAMTDLQATLTAIDDLAVDQCGHCDRPLRPDGPSLDFCDDRCQQTWTSRRNEVQELVGYREPVDLPQHAVNLEHDFSHYRTRLLMGASQLEPTFYLGQPGAGDAHPVISWTPAREAYEEAMWTAFEGLRDQVTRMGRDLGAGFRRAGEAIAAIGWPEPPADPDPRPPMLRAIEARRHRSTGPAAQSRAPRRIDPRRGQR